MVEIRGWEEVFARYPLNIIQVVLVGAHCAVVKNKIKSQVCSGIDLLCKGTHSPNVKLRGVFGWRSFGFVVHSLSQYQALLVHIYRSC